MFSIITVRTLPQVRPQIVQEHGHDAYCSEKCYTIGRLKDGTGVKLVPSNRMPGDMTRLDDVPDDVALLFDIGGKILDV